MGYITPADVDVSDDRAAHLARDSAEPGTDYKTPFGTDLRAPGHGRVIGVDHSNDGAEGRRLTFLMDNGEVIDWIHLLRISARVNDMITPGQRGLALSGASGFGKDRHYAPHLHVTRRARIGLPYRQTLDFEAAVERFRPAPTSSQSTPAAPAAPRNTDTEEDVMKPFIAALPGGRWALILPQGNAKPRAVTMQGNAGARAVALYGDPIPFDEEVSAKSLAIAVDGV